MPYQSFQEVPGDSNSSAKLAQLGLPADLSGKTVLDLGCNEGFFSIAAKLRGASHVVGLDIDHSIIAAAKKRAEQVGVDVDFHVGDMTRLRLEKFDYVLLISVLHYIEQPALMFQTLRQVMKPKGTLILELGLSPLQSPVRSVGRTLRAIDERFFPTIDILTQVWMRDYSIRLHGKSVLQNGDPMERFVFHCQSLQTNVIFIVGNGHSGKSHLSLNLGDSPVISTDQLFSPFRAANALVPREQKVYDDSLAITQSIGLTWNNLRFDTPTLLYFSEVICRAIRHCSGMGQVIVEGYVLSDLISHIEQKLGPTYRCWTAARSAD